MALFSEKPFTYLSHMKGWLLILLFLLPAFTIAQPYTREDTLRGSNGRGRSWWDVQQYDLFVVMDTADQRIRGKNVITFTAHTKDADSLQIDLQDGMSITSAFLDGVNLRISRQNNVYWLRPPQPDKHFASHEGNYRLEVLFQGKPRVAVNAPWDGGFIWSKDSLGNPWNAVACQGLGASSWWPCKDYQGDEPDSGMTFSCFNQGEQHIISNGRSYESSDTLDTEDTATGQITRNIYRTQKWQVKNPINTYSTTFYMGDYAHWHDTLHGEKGILDLDFYPLKYNEQRARKQWAVVKDMLRCYEYWMGPYPFYEDGYKLVEAPYLGMEHQSAIAYGNEYKMGYLGRGLGGAKVAMMFDYIIVHESGHEWFGNNITAQDIADNWLHEGFTTYTETLFAQWITDRDQAFEYTAGEWKHIANDYPVIGDYGVNDDKGSDKYYKGAAVVHMVRMMLKDDEKFRLLLRGLNKDFYHKIVTSAEVENYISRFTGKDLKPFFDQYLRTKNEPVLEWALKKGKLSYRWTNVVPGFSAPFTLIDKEQKEIITGNEESSLANRKFKKRKLKIVPCGWYEIRNGDF